MCDDFKEILEMEEKLTFTKEEKLNMYYVYSKNLLVGSKEFKNLDETLSELFFMMSKMLLNRFDIENNENHNENHNIDISKSIISKLSKEEQDNIFNEIDYISNSIKENI